LCYISRVENGHTVSSGETLEKYARALEVPLYKLFYDGTASIEKPKLPAVNEGGFSWGSRAKEQRELRSFVKALSRMDKRHRNLLFAVARGMARQREK
jgi:hypothetical protein